MRLPSLDAPIAEALRVEAEGMAHAYVSALSSAAPDGAIAGVYAKGSTCRPWNSLIDYVPELSDVDIHVRLARGYEGLADSIDFALDVGEAALAEYVDRFPSHRHIPRPQVTFLQHLESAIGYLPSTAGSVRTLVGEEYEVGTEVEYAHAAATDAERFRADAGFVLEELAGKVIDRPGRLMWPLVSRLTFRIAPAGPRLLTQLGMTPYRAWSLNRTAIAGELAERGHDELGGHYADFYLAGWAGFESGFTDTSAARRALMAAYRLYEDGREVVG